MERLDKLFSSCGILSRTECKIELKRCKITVNGEIVKDSSLKIDSLKDVVTYNGEVVVFNKYSYIMLNKPKGVISASTDGKEQTVIDILPEFMKRQGLFPCGRLDKDTVGLVIITNDGVSAHKKLSPKHHAKKVYYYECAEKLVSSDINKIKQGVLLKDGYETKPCDLEVLSDFSGNITLTEGKYHEIKRIFGSLGNKITYLKRISFAGIVLDGTLKEGEARYLTKEEIELFTK